MMKQLQSKCKSILGQHATAQLTENEDSTQARQRVFTKTKLTKQVY